MTFGAGRLKIFWLDEGDLISQRRIGVGELCLLPIHQSKKFAWFTGAGNHRVELVVDG